MWGTQAKCIKRVAIIGAGPSGLAAAKCCLEENLEPIVFERAGSIGGVWRYAVSPDKKKEKWSVAYKNLTTNSSLPFTAFSDFPFPFQVSGDYPQHREIVRYLEAYVDKFHLEKAICLNTTVLAISKVDGKWLVTSEHSGTTAVSYFDAVMVASGQFSGGVNRPMIPGEPFFGEKRIIHSQEYDTPDAFEGMNVIVVGIGNSALDIAADLVGHAASVTISSRSGSFVMPVRTSTTTSPGDQVLLNRFRGSLPTSLRQYLFYKYTVDLQRHFVDAGMISPRSPPHQSHFSIVKDPERFVDHLASKRIVIKPGIRALQPSEVVFDDGTKACADAIILCTGYEPSVEFLPRSFNPVKRHSGGISWLHLYKHILHPNDPTLAFLARVLSLGNEGVVGEMQARWTTKIWSGKARLPTKEKVDEEMNERLARIKRAQPKFPNFVNYVTYMDALASDIGSQPRLLRHPWLLRQLLFGPPVAAQFRIDGYGQKDAAFRIVSKL